jgi:DNA-binding NarL/FixJ family response regulator
MNGQTIRVLLADDQTLLLQSLKMALETLADDIEIVATADNGDEVLQILETVAIDVALLDIKMPVRDGISTAKEIRLSHPEVSVIMLTTFEDEGLIAEALAVGVHGYLLKNIAPDKLVAGIRAVRAGTLVLGMGVANAVVHAMERPQLLRLPTWFYELSPREKTLARMLLQGKSNKEIAVEIKLGEQTVRNYMSALYEKLEVSERKAAFDLLSTISPHWFDRS